MLNRIERCYLRKRVRRVLNQRKESVPRREQMNQLMAIGEFYYHKGFAEAMNKIEKKFDKALG